jgi:hypothetical protein
MPAHKEPSFFVTEFNWSRGLEWYERHFAAAGSASAVGEASAAYTMHPYSSPAAERIAQLLPQARLVYVVRNPIEQMLSFYAFRRRLLSERDSPERALRGSIYVETASYARQLELYLSNFTRDRILVVRSEDLRHARAETVARVFRFLGVDETWRDPEFDREFHVSAEERVPRPLVRRLVSPLLGTTTTARDRAAGKLQHLPLPTPVIRTIARFTHTQPRPVEISPALRRELTSLISDDVARLRELLGPEFDGWGIA